MGLDAMILIFWMLSFKPVFHSPLSQSSRPWFISPVQFSHSGKSNSLWPHGLHYARLPCPSPTPEACSNSYPSSWWCHPTISSSVIPFSSCLQSFPASGSFLMSWLFTSSAQIIGASAFLPRSNSLLISWVQLLSTVILEPKKIKSVTVSIVSPSICHEVMGLDAMIFVFECWVLSQLFHSPLSPLSRDS